MIERSLVRVPAGAAGEFYFAGVSFLCCLFIVGIRSTPMLAQQHVKDPGHSAKRAGGRLAAKHACTLHNIVMWLRLKWHYKLVRGCMVYTECAPRREQFRVAPATQQRNSAVNAPLRWIFKTALEKATVAHSKCPSLIGHHASVDIKQTV